MIFALILVCLCAGLYGGFMSDRLEKATLAGGCFWCIEAVFRRVQGVAQAISGYTGGSTGHPTYREVCDGDTGHAEAVQITFDPQVISFAELLEIFWAVHDPTTLNRQGADIGSQYRSAIFYHDPVQREIAEQSIRKENASGRWSAPLVTELAPLGIFYPAEPYHQDYYDANLSQPYCRMIIEPKLDKVQKLFANRCAAGSGR